MGTKKSRKSAGEKSPQREERNEEYVVESFRDLNIGNLKNVVLKNRYAQTLVVLFGAGFILRFFNLGFNSLWLDEATTLNYALKGYSEIWSSVQNEFHPPLFYWIEHFMLIFGESEFILRFMPALFGALAIPVFYLIGREAINREVGIISALLVTVSPFQIYYSQDARSYTMILLFFSISLLAYIYASKSRDLKWWIIFGVASAVAFWSHYYTIIGTGVIVLHAIATRYKDIMENKQFRNGFLISIVAFIIISIPLLVQLYERYLALSASPPTYGVLGLPLIFSSIISFSGFEQWIAVIFTILFIIGILYLYKKALSFMSLILCLFLIPLIFSVIISAKITMNPRYLIYLLPVFYLGIASAYMPIKGLIKNKSFIYVFMVIIILINIPFMMTYYTSYSKNDWRGFSGQLESITGEGDIIVVLPGYMKQPLEYYYSNETDSTIEFGAYDGKSLEKIYNQYPERNIFYIVTGDINAANPEGDALEWLNKNAKYVGQNMGIHLFAITPQK